MQAANNEVLRRLSIEGQQVLHCNYSDRRNTIIKLYKLFGHTRGCEYIIN